MVGFVAGLLTPAVVKIAIDKLSSAIAEQAGLVWNFRRDLDDMKDTMESMAAVLKDAERQSVRNESVRLWLKRLKHASLDISDMMDEYQHTDAQTTTKMPQKLSFLTATRKKKALANKMKNMRVKLRKINEQGQSFNFTLSTGASLEQQHYNPRETTSDVNEAQILGRDGEKKDIICILSSRRKDGTMVLPIYGLGGIGKSTLAQLVYNDTQFKQYYDHRVWVYVSEVFDLKKIGTSIISQLSGGGQQNIDELHMIYRFLDNLLPGKKILIVLDDIWQENVPELEKLKTMLHVDQKGSMVDVIVTTRSESIAKKICTNGPHKLQPLQDAVCWDIIKRSSGFKNKSNKEKLERIGMDIAKKCGGVALAAQAVGYMLRSKDLDGWLEINNSDIWNESSGVDNPQHMNVLPSLKLSYERMLPILKLCFSYCAIFLNGHDIHEVDLVHQWVALDFIKKPTEGKDYIKQLFEMSFLQHSKLPSTPGEKHATRYTMHDLVHDLARSVIEDELIVIDAAEKSSNTSEQNHCRYVLLKNYDRQTELSNILPKKVRALHFSSGSKLGPDAGSFAFAKCLRILDFSGCSGILLPPSVGQLKQLKCLIAPKVQNERLPKSIAQLTKLQYLNLRGSSLISALPESIGNLGCLKHLDLSGCSGILKVPESFGGLKNLVHLDMSSCSRITSLPASFGNLTNLQFLDLSVCSGVKELPESLGGLSQLQHLNLSSCYSITRLPEAIGSLINMQYFNLGWSTQIREVPRSFQNLQNLVHLDLPGCCCTKGLPEALHGLTALEHLDMFYFHILGDSCISGDLFGAIGNLTNLKYLNLERMGCAPDFIGTLTNLEHLVLSWNFKIVSLPESIGNLKRLHTLDLSGCRELKSLPDRISEITTLKSLLIEKCSNELIDQANSLLHYSLTLPLFKVRADDVNACSTLPLLENANVPELKIYFLENVRLPEEADKVKLLDKSNLSKLTLAWTRDENADRFLDDKDVLRQLVPPKGLKELNLEGYRSPSFPSWLTDSITHHLPNLVRITLQGLPTCSDLPPLGRLRNLEGLLLSRCPRVKKIDRDFCGGKGAFSRLSEFKLEGMMGLKEWSTTCSVEDGGVEEFMFPVLDGLVIENCPRLRLRPCLPVFRRCSIQKSDQVISSLEEVGNNTAHRASSSIPCTRMLIYRSDSESLGLFHHLPALQVLEIFDCPNLTGLPESMRHLSSLQTLEVRYCEDISALPEWMGDLSSLQELTIQSCRRIESLPPSVQQLTKLRKLRIVRHPKLKRWCELEENKKQLAHINQIIYEECD